MNPLFFEQSYDSPNEGDQATQIMKSNLTSQNQLHYGTIKLEAVHRFPPVKVWFGDLTLPQMERIG
jgi:hypothetical protein